MQQWFYVWKRLVETEVNIDNTCMSFVLSGSTGRFVSTSVSSVDSRHIYSGKIRRFIRMTYPWYLIPWYGVYCLVRSPFVKFRFQRKRAFTILAFYFFLFVAHRLTKVGSLIVSSDINSFPGIERIRRRSETKENYIGIGRAVCLRLKCIYSITTHRIDVIMCSTTAVHCKTPIKMIIRCWKHAEIFSVYFSLSLSFAVWNPDAHAHGWCLCDGNGGTNQR